MVVTVKVSLVSDMLSMEVVSTSIWFSRSSIDVCGTSLGTLQKVNTPAGSAIYKKRLVLSIGKLSNGKVAVCGKANLYQQ